MLKIRKIQAKDNLQMAKIVRDNLEEKHLALKGTAYFDTELDDLTGSYQRMENAAYWVLTDEYDKVLGGVGVAPYQGEVAELQKLYLANHAKGMGYGEMLLDTAVAFAKKNYSQLYLETFEALSAANHLYLKHGFVKLEEPFGSSEHNACDTWFMKNLQD